MVHPVLSRKSPLPRYNRTFRSAAALATISSAKRKTEILQMRGLPKLQSKNPLKSRALLRHSQNSASVREPVYGIHQTHSDSDTQPMDIEGFKSPKTQV